MSTQDEAPQRLIGEFHKWATKLAESDDVEVRALYKARLLKLLPELAVLGVSEQAISIGNSGITIQDSDVRDVIQQFHIHLHSHSEALPGPAELDLRNAYLSGLIARLNRVRIIGGEEWAERVRLSGVYIALMTDVSLKQDTRDERGEPLSAVDLLDRDRRLVLLGGPGSGKSTLASFVAMCLAGAALGREDVNLAALTADIQLDNDKTKSQSWAHGPLLPVMVELRDFASKLPLAGDPKPEALWDYIREMLAPKGFEPYLHAALCQPNQVLVILDGLDEVPDPDRRRPQVKRAIAAFVGLYAGCRVLVTSRTYAYTQQRWQLDDFAQGQLQPFSRF